MEKALFLKLFQIEMEKQRPNRYGGLMRKGLPGGKVVFKAKIEGGGADCTYASLVEVVDYRRFAYFSILACHFNVARFKSC